MKKLWKSTEHIIRELKIWNRWFLVTKPHRKSFEDLNRLYLNLINIDNFNKTGQLLWTKDDDFIKELEKCLLIY